MYKSDIDDDPPESSHKDSDVAIKDVQNLNVNVCVMPGSNSDLDQNSDYLKSSSPQHESSDSRDPQKEKPKSKLAPQNTIVIKKNSSRCCLIF